MECYSVLAFCYNKYKKYVNKEDKMKTLTLQYTISQKGWTDLRQNGKISIDEQSYLLNAIRTQDQYFKNIYLEQYLLQKIIKDTLPEAKKPILAKKIPISCTPFPEHVTEMPDAGEILLELEVPENEVVTVDYRTWLYLASEVNKTVEKYNSMKDMNTILKLPEKKLKIDKMMRVQLLDVLNPAKTMNFIPELKLDQVKKAYQSADGQLEELEDY
ncbi:hypothetical protein EFR95_04430 [Lactobacillus amylovorus]|jgi:hypothetical protein|nr:hypothetical protein [Lactobacillus amylovorus]UNL45837.1 hypothetical protein G8B20_03740 [Lactobacillus amylovorus]GMM21245.1 hypothetical protein LAYK10_05470 [Lactobacillus amylovorus]HBQ08961.1 hypothetical protein [Lactobacillus sp.]